MEVWSAASGKPVLAHEADALTVGLRGSAGQGG